MLTRKQDNLAKVPILVTAITEEERIKQQRMNDVLLLLEQLVEREEVTVKRILDCLYDVGSINLINKKFKMRSLNRFLKWIAKLTRPTFRVVALYWFKRNCPLLITNWLATKVKF